MKQNNTLKTKNMNIGRRIAITLASVALFASYSALVCFADNLTGGAHTAVSPHAAIPRPTPPDRPLNGEAVSSLVEDLKSSLDSSIEDEDAVTSIGKKWDVRNLVGKTRSQILDILFADVKSVVSDKATQDKVWASWKNVGVSDDAETTDLQPVKPPLEPDPKPTPTATPTPTPPQPAIRPAIIRDDDMIDLGEPPLSDADMEQMMQWIGARTAALRLPFCWKLFENRPNNDLGVPMTCKAGYNQDTNGLCYKNCAAGERGIATFCYNNCPGGYRDDGLYCGKPGPYGRGTGYAMYVKCLPPPPGQFRRFCAADPNARAQNCEKDHGVGNCEEWGSLWYPKCKPGFHNVGANICSPDCPAGWEDIGVSCKKPNYAREVLPLTECSAGREKSGLLCYPPCTKPGYEGIMNSCFQKCGGGRPWDCGGACSTDQKECAVGVVKQVVSIPMAIISFLTFGEASLVFAPARAAEVAASVTKLAAMVAKVKEAALAAKGSIEQLAGGAANLQKLGNAVKIGGKLYTAGSAVGREVDMFSKEFANNFDAWTSPEIAKEIDQRFGKDAAFQIKRKWGLRHLALMLKADGIESAKNVIGLVSAVDITGVAAIMDAFLHPACTTDLGFPKVTPLYNH